MSFSIAICGLPNVGKSTLFSALTKKVVPISPVPFTTIKPNVAKVKVKDERLEKLAEVIKPERKTETQIEFWDIAGLVKGASKGEGLGNQFLAEIKHTDGLLLVARAFEDEKIENYLGEINPKKEFEILETEFLLKDLETIGRVKEKMKRNLKRLKILEKIENEVEKGKKISQIPLTKEEIEEIEEYQFLSLKPIIYLINVNEKERNFGEIEKFCLKMNLKEELEILELSEKEREDLGLISRLDLLIKKCYDVLNLITFFTVTGGKEAKAWTLPKGETVLAAARKVHSDFAKKFIKAEVISWKELVQIGSLHGARELGKTKIVGKDYLVEDGDVIEFKI